MAKEDLRIQINKVLNDESNPNWNHLDQVYPGIFIGDEYVFQQCCLIFICIKVHNNLCFFNFDLGTQQKI